MRRKPTATSLSSRVFYSMALFAFLMAGNSATVSAASFFGLGDLPGGLTSSHALDVSGDGSTVVGFGNTALGSEAFRWTSETGMVGLGDLPGGAFGSLAYGVSRDGSTVVGAASSNSDPISTRSTGEAFRWTSETGMVGLGDLAGGAFSSQARGISADGSTVVGIGGIGIGSGREAFRWTSETGMVGLGDLAGGGFESLAWGISADGSTIVGRGDSERSGPFEEEAFRWTNETEMVGLGDLPGGNFLSLAFDVSGDGSTVVGYGDSALGRESFIWTSKSGMRNLQSVLTTDFGLGASVSGWRLNEARSISEDGRTIIGNGVNPSGSHVGWIVQLDAGPIQPELIPEPSTLLLFGSGLLGLLAWRKRNPAKAKSFFGIRWGFHAGASDQPVRGFWCF